MTETKRIKLSRRDREKVLDLLEHVPAPNDRLREAMGTMPAPK